jgi:ABC-type transporter Mla MlaB component
MATPISGKPGTPQRPTAVPAAKPAPAAQTPSTEQILPDSTNFPPLYEAAILYAAGHSDAAQETLKDYMKTTDGKNSIRTWLMLFDFYHLTANRREFDALSMLYTVKFERSPPVWTDTLDTADPRRKEKRERKDFYVMAPDSDGALLGEIDKFESFAKEMGSCRVDFAKVKSILSEEAELFAIVFQRLRRAKIPVWFNAFDAFATMLRASINETTGLPLNASQGFWSLLFELYIFEGKTNEYEELGLEYAVAFEMSPPAWQAVNRPLSDDDPTASAGPSADKATMGFPIKGVVSAASKDVFQQLSLYAASKQEVVIDTSDLMRIDFTAVTMFFEAIRGIHSGQKRVILSNLNELVAALLEVFGITKHAILMRKKAG